MCVSGTPFLKVTQKQFYYLYNSVNRNALFVEYIVQNDQCDNQYLSIYCDLVGVIPLDVIRV